MHRHFRYTTANKPIFVGRGLNGWYLIILFKDCIGWKISNLVVDDFALVLADDVDAISGLDVGQVPDVQGEVGRQEVARVGVDGAVVTLLVNSLFETKAAKDIFI